MRKLKFYLMGFIPGLVIVFFILNQKGASCSGYFPSGRVIAESMSKKWKYEEGFKTDMQELNIKEDFLKDSLFVGGKIDFDQSQAQKEPCPEYLLLTPKKNPVYAISFKKCKELVALQSMKKIQK